MNSVVVLQARTSSSRLPGKVLLPINGLPLVILASMRAANTGRQVVIATSAEHSDDGLAALVEGYGLTCFRGSLNNTLDRVVSALSAFDDQTIVFRLTADNLFPDGALLDEIENDFLDRNIAYLSCNGEPSGLPYGMSAEVTRLAHLREANRKSALPYDQEHVTPLVVRKFGAIFFERYKSLKKGHYRCTIDCLDDYLVIQQVFSDVADPVSISSFDLIRRLDTAPYKPIAAAPVPRLVFGAAQLGSNYGIANTVGQPDQQACQSLIKTAISNGVAYLDTAHAYGNSEAMIGQSLKNGWEGRVKVITKLSPLQDCPQNASKTVLNAFVDASIFESCSRLSIRKIDVLMLHRTTHLFDWNGGVWQRLLELKTCGVIGELGVSVQNPMELASALDITEVRYIQLPFNLLDWRWDEIIPKLLKIRASRQLTIHVRSALLQGLLPSKDENLWQRAHVEPSLVVRDWLLNQAEVSNRANVTDLCLSYVNSLPWVDGIATGMESMEQLIENITYFNRPALTMEQVETIKETRPKLSENSLNPALWK